MTITEGAHDDRVEKCNNKLCKKCQQNREKRKMMCGSMKILFSFC